ncbi:hypothetical protein JB92DRAFT_3129533 [Gautieria morchelliformis]|nr:hypothetical protein JB92DRAFT_3129533 [Gautieria morchelliformis]
MGKTRKCLDAYVQDRIILEGRRMRSTVELPKPTDQPALRQLVSSLPTPPTHVPAGPASSTPPHSVLSHALSPCFCRRRPSSYRPSHIPRSRPEQIAFINLRTFSPAVPHPNLHTHPALRFDTPAQQGSSHTGSTPPERGYRWCHLILEPWR